MRSLRTLLIAAAAALLIAPQAVAAQPSPSQSNAQFSGKVEVKEVLLDAVVTDGRGKVVPGLTKNDFVVREDGKPVKINNVQFYNDQATPAQRHFILFFQDPARQLPRLSVQLLDAGRWAKRWVDEQLQDNDYVAVLGYDFALEPYQDFTNDHQAIKRAIDEAVQSKRVSAMGKRAADSLASLAALPSPEKLDKVTPRIYDALKLVGVATAAPARVNMVLFSIGFGDVDSVGLYLPDQRYYPETVRQLNDNNVAVYAIDLIPSSPFGSLRTRVLESSLSSLAADTGGRYYYTFSNFGTPLEQIADDLDGYYLLSYTSRHADDAQGYQKVSVDTVDPSLNVRSRQGYLYGDTHGG